MGYLVFCFVPGPLMWPQHLRSCQEDTQHTPFSTSSPYSSQVFDICPGRITAPPCEAQ